VEPAEAIPDAFTEFELDEGVERKMKV